MCFSFQILQNALIKRKLEEQKERFRRTQEGHVVSQVLQEKPRATDSPMLSNPYTPTAVMKKYVADRRDSDPVSGKMSVPELKVSQSCENGEGLGGAAAGQNQQQQFNRVSPISALGMIPPGSGMLPIPGSQTTPNQLLLLQQQQHQMRMQAMQHHISAMKQQQAAISPTSLIDAQQLMFFQQHQQQQQQQQLHFGQQHPTAGFGRNVGQQQHHHHQQQHSQSRGHMFPPQQQQVSLSQFFSQEIMAQAQAGKAPAMPPLPTQKAMTLEEIERQAAAVRN